MLPLKLGRIVLFGLVTSLLGVQASAQTPPRTPLRSPTNGPWQKPGFFPIAVWYQQANSTGHSGRYATLAAAAAASRINVFLGQGADWPENYGADNGEIEAIQQNGLYLIGGIAVPSTENSSAHSVSSILALAHGAGADANLIGYNAGDEPQCDARGLSSMAAVPTVVSDITKYDPTRIVTFNQTDWMIQPEWQHNPTGCLASDQTALHAVSVASFDYYPETSPYIASQLNVTGSDFKSVGNDSLWVQGLSVQALAKFALPGQPLWAYVEAGGDNFGLSEVNNVLSGSVAGGSTTLVNASGRSSFTESWLGLAVSGTAIPSGTTIVGVIDATHATMSRSATGTSSGSITVGSGPLGDCVVGVNLCVVNGNEYRPTPAQVSAEVWMSIINGATGIEYFCHDATSYSFCLGDSGAGGAAATATQVNLSRVDRAVLSRAEVLNAPTSGICSMQQFNYTTGVASIATSCSNGVLSMATRNPAVPGMALAKSYDGATYLFAQSDRRSPSGADFTFGLAGLAGHPATVIFDTNSRYDRAHTSHGKTFTLDGSGGFTDTLGANHNDYQVKIYRID